MKKLLYFPLILLAIHTAKASPEEENIFCVKTLKGETHKFNYNADLTIADVKKDITSEGLVETDDVLKLIYNGKQLEDQLSLKEYDINKGATLYLVVQLKRVSSLKNSPGKELAQEKKQKDFVASTKGKETLKERKPKVIILLVSVIIAGSLLFIFFSSKAKKHNPKKTKTPYSTQS